MGMNTSKYSAGDVGNIKCILNAIIISNKFSKENPVPVYYIGSNNENGVHAFVDFLKPLNYIYLGICFYIVGNGFLGNEYQLMAYKINVDPKNSCRSLHFRRSNLI